MIRYSKFPQTNSDNAPFSHGICCLEGEVLPLDWIIVFEKMQVEECFHKIHFTLSFYAHLNEAYQYREMCILVTVYNVMYR